MLFPLLFLDATLQQSRPSLVQEEAEPPQIKEEPEELLDRRTKGDNLSGEHNHISTGNVIALVIFFSIC